MYGRSVGDLIRKRRIDKPQEEFVLPPPPPEEVTKPEPEPREDVEEPALPSLRDELLAEAAILDELLTAIIETAEPVSVPVDESDRDFLGERITVRDYIESFGDDGPRARRLRSQFEDGLLDGCGSGWSWPVLLGGDLRAIRDLLLYAAGRAEYEIDLSRRMSPALSGVRRLEDGLLPDYSRNIYRRLIDHSRAVRLELENALGNLLIDIRGSLIRCLVDQVALANDRQLRAALRDLRDNLNRIRTILCHAQFLSLLRFKSIRDAVIATIRELVVRQLIDALLEALDRTHAELVLPIVDLFTQPVAGGHSVADCIEDAVSEAVANTVLDAVYSLTFKYERMAAEVINELDRESRYRLEKVRELNRWSTVGRWIAHLDSLIFVIDQWLSLPSISGQIIGELYELIDRPNPPPPSRLLSRLGLSVRDVVSGVAFAVGHH